ncbi:MAG: ADP-ribose pyrophosphatase [Desulfuromonas sp.]|nr:MAG: ADP-ribose pyrophosphatase [Desulfuromonas sp.]
MASTKLHEEPIYRGKIVDLARETHRLPDGREAGFEVIRHPGGAAALPVLEDGRLILIRQFRPAIEGHLLEIPAGRLEPGEDGRSCVARELEEEIGYKAGRFEPLADIYSSVGFCNEQIFIYLAEDLQQTTQALELDEFIELQIMTLDQALDKMNAGEIRDAKTRVALLEYALKAGTR